MSWLIETLVATTILMVVVLLIRRPVAATFGARAAYALWLLPALRAITPPLPEAIGPAPLAQLPVLIEIEHLSLAAAPALPAFDWGTLVLALWLAGAGVLIAWQLCAYHRFVSTALRSADDLPELDMGQIEVCASPLVEGPFAAGILVPRVVLPRDWRRRYTSDELRLALRHEAVHHARGDLSVNLIALAMLALHWFNPVAWFAWRAFRADQELACDAAVLDGASAGERHSYGSALVKSACPRTPVAACSLNPRDQLKQRLRMMRAGPDRRVAGRALAGALTVAGLALTASGSIAAETTEEFGETVRARVIAPAVEAVAAVVPVGAPYATIPPVPTEPERVEPREPPEPPAPVETVEVDVDEALRVALAEVPEPPEAPEAPEPPVPPHAVAPRAPPVPVMPRAVQACRGKPMVSHTSVVTGHRHMRVIVCGHGPSEVQIRKLTINALSGARIALAGTRGFDHARLEQALAGVAAEMARLRAREPFHREK